MLTKQLISKIYYSRSQEGYLKRFGTNKTYAQELAEEMGRVDKKRLAKIVEEVSAVNDIFHRYLLHRGLTRLRPEDVVEFEEGMEAEHVREVSRGRRGSVVRVTGQSALRRLNSDIVRIGFMMVLERLKNDQANHFINEVKCLQETICRENHTLHGLGYEYAGVSSMYRDSQLVEEIANEEKENGAFKLIGGKIR